LSSAPWLLLAVGNPSRGDDALGPQLLQRLRELDVAAGGDVELLGDFQLQIEHALDLRGRHGVLFIDAAHPGAATAAQLLAIAADPGVVPASHALRPQALLRVAERIDGTAPPAWQLAIEGASFGLGDALSATARAHLDAAEKLALHWLQARRAALASRGAVVPAGA
jgi:hydrogenase maturation protease